MGFLTDIPIGFPGYNGRIPRSAATLPRILRDAGYSTFAVGKWHLAPRWEQSASGPFDRWPLGLGFERYYGFLGGDTNQWTPELVRRQPLRRAAASRPRTATTSPRTSPTAPSAFVQDQQQATPGQAVLPLLRHRRHARAPPRRRPSGSTGTAGSSTTAGRRGASTLFARQLELGDRAGRHRAHRTAELGPAVGRARRRRAPALRPPDGGVRRVPHPHRPPDRAARRVPRASSALLDDTLAAPAVRQRHERRGRPARLAQRAPVHPRPASTTSPTRSAASTTSAGSAPTTTTPGAGRGPGNTPLRLWKRYTWLGGVRTPLIVHWPERHRPARGEVRSQFCHAVDLMPTVLDAAGVAAPDGRRRRSTSSRSTAPACCRRSPTPARRARARPSTSRCSAAARSTTTGGRRRPTTSASSSASSASSSRAATTSTTTAGACSTSTHDFSEARDLADEQPDRVRPLDRAVVGRGRPQPGAAARRQLHRAGGRARAVAVPAAVPHRVPARRRADLRGRAPAARRRVPAARRASSVAPRRRGDRVRARATGTTAGRSTCSTGAWSRRSTCSATPHRIAARRRGRTGRARRRASSTSADRRPAAR